MKKMILVALAATSLVALSGCATPKTVDEQTPGTTVAQSVTDGYYSVTQSIVETKVKISNGRTVTCLVVDAGKNGGGISCDWGSASDGQ